MIEAVERATPRPALHHWTRWVVPATIAWSLVCATMGLFWLSGGAGYPFTTTVDPQAGLSLLSLLDPRAGAALIAGFGIAGVIAGMAMTRSRGRVRTRRLLLAWAAVAAIILGLVLPDYRLLVLAAYAPVFVVGGLLGVLPADVSYFDAITWPVAVQAASVLGAIGWAGSGIAYGRASREEACLHCGRDGLADGWASPARARAWGRWAVLVAVAIPLVYATTRYAWALGIPLGISDELLRSGQDDGMWVAGAGLATVAVVGAVLTTGLVSRWGEAVPRWVPFLGGRAIPPMVATLPALVVAMLVTSAGLMFVRMVLMGGLESFGGADALGTIGPELLWPIWGVALGAAAIAYHLRRRGACQECGRGEPLG
jgi:hypothetical protein